MYRQLEIVTVQIALSVTVTVIDGTVLIYKHQSRDFCRKNAKISSSIYIMVVAKGLCIPEIFMLRNPGNLRQFQRTGGVSFLKGVRILMNNDYHLLLSHRNRTN